MTKTKEELKKELLENDRVINGILRQGKRRNQVLLAMYIRKGAKLRQEIDKLSEQSDNSLPARNYLNIQNSGTLIIFKNNA